MILYIYIYSIYIQYSYTSTFYRNFRHLPVVDSKDEVVGILSVKDIVREISGESKSSRGFWLMEYFKPKEEQVKLAAAPETPTLAASDVDGVVSEPEKEKKA